jgi:hypothetical protein
MYDENTKICRSDNIFQSTAWPKFFFLQREV